MNAKRLLTATIAAVALSPLAAFAEGGASQESQAWLASIKSTKSVAEVRAGLDELPQYGQLHPVELQTPAGTMLTRAQVLQQLATLGTIRVGA